MGLQLRLTHSLGDRLIDVEARPADRAIVVGRASDAAIPVPSATVAKAHCLLFVHEGRWVVQDAGSSTGTYLNGVSVDEPRFVGSGDVITLGGGNGAPTLVVDPHHIGVTEEVDAPPAPAGRSSHGGHASSGLAMPPPSLGYAAGAAPYAPPPPMPAPATRPRGFIEDDEDGEGGEDNIFGAAAAAPTVASVPGAAYPSAPYPGGGGGFGVPGYGQAAPPPAEQSGWEDVKAEKRYYVPKKQGTSSTTIAVVAVASVCGVIGASFWIYNAYQRAQEASKPKVIIIDNTPKGRIVPRAPTSIFEDQTAPGAPAKQAATQQAKPRSAVPPSPKPVSEMVDASKPDAEGAPVNINSGDADWDAVVAARRNSEASGTHKETALAVVKYYLYRERFPDKNQKELEQLLDEAADTLWWKRIDDLFHERDAAQKEIADRRLQVSQSQDANFKKELEAEMAKFAERRDRAEETLRNQMKFTRQTPPNLYDPHDRAILKSAREPKQFEEWKGEVLRRIKSSNGERLPWQSSR